MKPLIGTDLKRFVRDFRRAHPPRHNLVLVLQSVEYPANVGSAFRIADAVGASELILTGITPTPPNPAIDKVARYKSLRVPWRYEADPLIPLTQLKDAGYRIVAVELTAEAVPYYEYDYAQNVCLLVGHEDHGVTRATLELCDSAVFIPMYGKGLSLNVHVALGIVAFHVRHLD